MATSLKTSKTQQAVLYDDMPRRPSSTSSDLLDQLVLLDSPFLIAGDFNVPGDVEGHDNRTADMFL